MRTYTKQELEERYEKLPDALKDAIFSTEIADKIFETGKKNGLTVEKIGFLAEETGRVILGLTRPNEFVGLLAELLGSTTDAAQKIASDINHAVFFPLREVLKQTHQVDVGEAARPAPDVARPLVARSNTPAPVRPIPMPPSEKATLAAERPERKEIPLVGIGEDIKIPSVPPSNFLTREEVEKMVAEKGPLPAVSPASPPPASASKGSPIDLRKKQEPIEGTPVRTALSAGAGPTTAAGNGDGTREQGATDTSSMRSTTRNIGSGNAQSPAYPQPIGSNASNAPAQPEKPPLLPPPRPPAPPVVRSIPLNIPPSKIPPIDLRPLGAVLPTPVKPIGGTTYIGNDAPNVPKTKPWNGSDPYREPVE